MRYQEKALYHQIHPLKLAADWIFGIIFLYFLWQHQLFLGVVVLVIPSFLTSFLLIRFANLERLKDSSFGRYIKKYMSKTMQLLRLVGFSVMAFGAWFNSVFFIVFGLTVILAVWSRGYLLQYFHYGQ